MVGLDDCRASAVLNTYLDMIHKVDYVNILEIKH